MHTCPYDYFFVTMNKNKYGVKKYNVLRQFYINKFNEESTIGQYVTSNHFQSVYNMMDDIEFYIIGINNENIRELQKTQEKPQNKQNIIEYIQSIFNTNMNNIYDKCDIVYHFILPKFDNYLYDKYFKLIDNLQKSSQVHDYIDIKSDDNKCVLSLCMLVTRELQKEKEQLIILNNPSFRV